MADLTFYEYNVTPTGASGSNEYALGTEVPGPVEVVLSDLSPGDGFVVGGTVFTYEGAADLGGKGGTVEGFFALNNTTNTLVFFSPNYLAYGTHETLYLNTHQSDWTCFMAGTRIATPDGFANVEDLAMGDPVLTADGEVAPVKWLGRQTVSTIFANPNRALPIRIRAGALDENLPVRDLLVSPCHAIFVDGVLVQAGALVNGSSIVREADVPTNFVYYHIELENHALILAEGVAAETFVDNVDRLAFDNWDEHQRLYPEGHTIQELPYPRAASARQVPGTIVRRLAERVSIVAGPLRAAA